MTEIEVKRKTGLLRNATLNTKEIAVLRSLRNWYYGVKSEYRSNLVTSASHRLKVNYLIPELEGRVCTASGRDYTEAKRFQVKLTPKFGVFI